MNLSIKQYVIKLCLSSVLMMSIGGTALASGHFISGLQAKHPEYDLNVSYVFQSSEQGYTSFITSANPSSPGAGEVAASGKDFGENGLYNLHIALDDTFEKGMTFVFSVNGRKVKIRKIDDPNAAEGDKGKLIGQGDLAKIIKLPDGIKAWVGRGKDPFFGNGVDLAKFNAAKQKGKFKPELFEKSGDLFVGSYASFFVLDVPNKLLGEKIKFFNTTATKVKDEWKQVDRHANVLFPYIFLADTPAVQEDHGQHRPNLDVAERRQTIIHNVFWAITTSKSQLKDPMKYAYKIADLIIPDVLTYQVGSEAHYTLDGLNGRALHDDAMNTALHLMMGVAVDDHANDAKRYKNNFPYIAQ